jgi:hypothetical protein
MVAFARDCGGKGARHSPVVPSTYCYAPQDCLTTLPAKSKTWERLTSLIRDSTLRSMSLTTVRPKDFGSCAEPASLLLKPDFKSSNGTALEWAKSCFGQEPPLNVAQCSRSVYTMHAFQCCLRMFKWIFLYLLGLSVTFKDMHSISHNLNPTRKHCMLIWSC